MNRAKIIHLRKLLAKATPGPWDPDPRGGGCVRGGRSRQYARGEVRCQVALATGDSEIDPAEVAANAQLISAAVNSLPILLDALEKADDLIVRILLNCGCDDINPCANCKRIDEYLEDE